MILKFILSISIICNLEFGLLEPTLHAAANTLAVQPRAGMLWSGHASIAYGTDKKMPVPF